MSSAAFFFAAFPFFLVTHAMTGEDLEAAAAIPESELSPSTLLCPVPSAALVLSVKDDLCCFLLVFCSLCCAFARVSRVVGEALDAATAAGAEQQTERVRAVLTVWVMCLISIG
jgi:hypothetical protein